MAERELKVMILGDASSAQRAFGQVASTSEGLGQKLKGVAKVVGPALIAGVGVLAKGALDAAAEANKVAAQTEAVIASTGGAAGVTAKHVGDLAHKLQGLSGVSDEAIQTGQNMLLTFTNIQGTNFDAATRSMLDLSVATGTDAKSAALQLGKALNDPVKGISALTRVGVSFTQQQKDQIKAMVAAGDTAGAQKVILAEMNKEFGGSAKAAGDAMTPMQRLGLVFGDLQETVGQKLLPVIEKLATWLSEHSGLIAPLAAVIGGVLVAAFTAWAISAASAAVATLAAAAPIIAIVAAVALVAAGIYYLVKNWDEVWSKVKEIAGNAIGAVLGFLSDLPRKIVELLASAGGWLLDIGKKILEGLYAGVKEIWEREVKFWTGLPGKIVGLLGDVASWLLDVGKKILGGLWDGIKFVWDREVAFWTEMPSKIWGLLGDVGTWLLDTGKKILTGLWNGLKAVWTEIARWIKEKMDWIIGKAKAAVEAITSIPDKVGGAIDKVLPGHGLNPFKLHGGGLVPGPTGADVPAILQAGELVLTRAQQGAVSAAMAVRGGVNMGDVTIIVQAADDPQTTAEKVRDELVRFARRNGNAAGAIFGGLA